MNYRPSYIIVRAKLVQRNVVGMFEAYHWNLKLLFYNRKSQ